MTMRIALAAAALAAVLAGVAGCAGGSGGTTAGSAAPATGPGTRSAPPRPRPPRARRPSPAQSTGGSGPSHCHTSELSASLSSGEPGAGQRYATLSLTNTSARTCTVFGYGGLHALDAAKQQLPITLTRAPGGRSRYPAGARGERGPDRPLQRGAARRTALPHPRVRVDHPAGRDQSAGDRLVARPVCGDKMDGWPYG